MVAALESMLSRVCSAGRGAATLRALTIETRVEERDASRPPGEVRMSYRSVCPRHRIDLMRACPVECEDFWTYFGCRLSDVSS